MRDFNAADMERSFSDNNSPPRLSDAAVVKLVSVDEDQTFHQPPLAVNEDGQNNANPISNSIPSSQRTREETRKERHRLRKSQSENVALMRAMNSEGSFALGTSTLPQRRSLANKSRSSSHMTAPLQREKMEKETGHPNKLSPEWLTLKEELSPIKSEEEDTNARNNDDNVLDHKDEAQVESPSKFILPPPTTLSTSRVKKSDAFTQDDLLIPSGRRAPREDTDAATPNGTANASGILDRKQERRQRRSLATRSEGVAFMRSSLADTGNFITTTTTSLAPVCELGGDAQLETLAGLAKLSTKDLPEIPPFEEKRRRSRLRSVSDGVSSMRNLASDTDSPKSLVLIENKETVKQSSAKALVVSDNDLPEGKNRDLCLDQDQAKPSNRVSFSGFHSVSSPNALSTTDRMSIDSAASVDGDSDIDDVPDALPVNVSVTPSKHIMFARPRIDLTSFLQSAKYRAASFLYGPMISLFMIG